MSDVATRQDIDEIVWTLKDLLAHFDSGFSKVEARLAEITKKQSRLDEQCIHLQEVLS
jgi:hypothetical protein